MYETVKIIEQVSVCRDVFALTVSCKAMAEQSSPGQFFMLKGWQGNDPFLMRPISINSIDAENGCVSFLYKLVGRGTRLISQLGAGDGITLLGPVGKGFPMDDSYERVAVIGRGIGIAPLRPLVEQYRRAGTQVYCYLSAKNDDFLFHKELFEKLGAVVRSTTQADVNVTDSFAEDLKSMKFDCAYSCGSNRLAKHMKSLHDQYGFPAYVSLEEHMACGVGACKGCVCTEYDTRTGEEKYARVCKSGPVFDVERVIK